MELVALFYIVDEFCKEFEPKWRAGQITAGERQRCKPYQMPLSDILTIIIHFHQSDFRHFRTYYCQYVSVVLKGDFRNLVSYNRFVEIVGEVNIPLTHLLVSLLAAPTTANYIDSTKLAVCHNRRIRRHKVFKGLAARGKTSMGWFYGFKLHLIVNERGQLVSFLITPGNVPDNNVRAVTQLARRTLGRLFGDRGYISKDLFAALWQQGVQLITGLKKNMKNKLLPLMDKVMLRGRSIIETINDQLKNTQQIEHSRHRSVTGFGANLLSGLIAYQLQPKKPELFFTEPATALLKQVFLLEG